MAMPERENIKIVSIGWKIMKKKPEFHGSDLEKIADYYHLNKENIILFGANVNPLGLSGQVKKDLAEHLDIISSYPDRDYTDLKKAIAAYTNTSPEHIVVGNGSTELISLLISQRAPKRALLLGPTYSEYARELNLVGGTLEYYNLKEEQDFRLDISDLTDTLKSDIDLLIICNPNNPTGYLYTRREMNQIRDLVKKYDLYLFSDEVYREFIYTGSPYISACHLEGIEDNVVLIDSVSKRYSECGIRIGALITKNKAVRQAVMKFCQARLSPPLIGQIAAEASLETPEDYLRDTYDEYVERRKCLIDGLNRIPGVYSPIPMGAFYTVAKLPVDDSEKFCAWCLSDFSYEGETVMMAPAAGFYTTPGAGRNEVRIAYVLKKEDLIRALFVLHKALEAYPGRTE